MSKPCRPAAFPAAYRGRVAFTSRTGGHTGGERTLNLSRRGSRLRGAASWLASVTRPPDPPPEVSVVRCYQYGPEYAPTTIRAAMTDILPGPIATLSRACPPPQEDRLP